jgi:hypothetical protein
MCGTLSYVENLDLVSTCCNTSLSSPCSNTLLPSFHNIFLTLISYYGIDPAEPSDLETGMSYGG